MPVPMPFLPPCGRSLPTRWCTCGRRWPAIVVVFCVMAAGAVGRAEEKPGLSGVEIVPADAAYFSATLRAREQYDLIVKSNAVASILKLPGVARALASLEEQQMMPGNPLSMVDSVLQLPENQQAVALLADMVATDTFVYAEPSCIKVLRLVQKLQAAQQVAALDMARNAGANDDDDDDGDGGENRQALAILEAAAANLDLVVLPDLVWGFTITKPDAAKTQLARLETIARFGAQTSPDLAGAVERTKIAGGDFLTITIPARLATAQLDAFVAELGIDAEAGDGKAVAIDKLLKRLRGLDLVIAIGLIGDRVILSIGDAVDHLDKLALSGSGRKGLITHSALAPLLPHQGKRLTGISYTSRELANVNGDPSANLGQLTALLDNAAMTDDVPADARGELKKFATRVADGLAKRLPQPAATLAFSFLTADGYEGYTWLWGDSLGLDGTRPLGLLSRVGGAPLAFAVSRMKSDPAAFTDLTTTIADGWQLFKKHGLPEINDDDTREKVEEFDEHLAPLVGKLADIVRKKFLPALADGQVGMVFDAPAKTPRLHDELPASAAPLPIPDLSLVLPLADASLFREALSDLFALGDEWVAELREMDPDAVPEGYEVPEPEKTKVDGGSVWSYSLAQSGLDEKIRPSIAIGDKAAVFSMVPGQAGRLLGEKPLETGARRADFGKPLAAAAAADVPRILDAIEPWLVYLIRYRGVMQREGQVDADRSLDADIETPEVKEIREHLAVILDAAKAFRSSVAETTVNAEATVTHWRNEIRDLPATK